MRERKNCEKMQLGKEREEGDLRERDRERQREIERLEKMMRNIPNRS